MKFLKHSQVKVFTQIARLSQKSLLKTMKHYLTAKNYETIYATENYIYAIGDIPITLVAHLDTVFKNPPKNIYYDKKHKVLWSPQGLGADDRAGVFLIIQLLQRNLKPTIILTTDEEIGGLGAIALIQDFNAPAALTNFIIELDRSGANDCVFYHCDNSEFTNYIEGFGFVKDYGSFTDISIICPNWGVAGVNLSVGYNNEHYVSEVLHVDQLDMTLSRVYNILVSNDIPAFEYIEVNFLNEFSQYPPLSKASEFVFDHSSYSVPYLPQKNNYYFDAK